jgi:cytochrome c553
MLSSRQQQCLRGIGITHWRERGVRELDAAQQPGIVEPLSDQDLAAIGQFIASNSGADESPPDTRETGTCRGEA